MHALATCLSETMRLVFDSDQDQSMFFGSLSLATLPAPDLDDANSIPSSANKHLIASLLSAFL